METTCVSLNIGPATNNEVTCQLSDSDHLQNPQDLKPKEDFIYRGTEVRNSNRSDGNLF